MIVKKRHKIMAQTLGEVIVRVFAKKLNLEYEKTDMKAPFIALANHCSDYDAFFVGRQFRCPIYFLMSDHVSSLPIVGKLIDFLVHPIPITKSSKMDFAALRDIGSVIKENGSVCIFPEGNKSIAGECSDISIAIVKLIKRLGVTVVVYNIFGGYFANPRWATEKKRKGKVWVKEARIFSVEEMAKMDTDELHKLVVEALNVNAYEVQAVQKIKYVGENLAEGFEHLFYVCPGCNSISSLESFGSTIRCKKCDMTWIYTEEGYLTGGKFEKLNEWDKWQKEYITSLDFEKTSNDEIILQDSPWSILRKISRHKNEKLGDFTTILYKDRLVLKSDQSDEIIEILLNNIRGMALEGKNGIQITTTTADTFRFQNSTRLSGLKYLNYIWALKKEKMLF